MTILQFEFKKFLSNSKNLMLLAIGILTIGIICFTEIDQLKREREEIISNDSRIYMKLMSDAQLAEIEYPELLENFQTAMTAIDNKLKFANEKEWKKSLRQEMIFIKNVTIIAEVFPVDYLDNYKLEVVEKNKFFLEKNVKPDNSLYGVSAAYFVRKISSLIFSLFGYLFFLLLFYDIYSGEQENNHLPFLKTLPVKFQKFTLIKLWLAITLIIVSLGLSISVAYLAGLILSGQTGTLLYPMFIKKLAGNVTTLSFPTYFLHAGYLFILINYLIILTLSAIKNIRLSSQKILVIFISTLSVISVFSQFFHFKSYFLSLTNLLNTHQEIEWLFKNNYLTKNIAAMIALTIVMGVLTIGIVSKKEAFNK